MRDIKTLWGVILENRDELDIGRGLCYAVSSANDFDLISHEESREMRNYILRNRPNKWLSRSARSVVGTQWHWKRGDVKHRIKWMKKHSK